MEYISSLIVYSTDITEGFYLFWIKFKPNDKEEGKPQGYTLTLEKMKDLDNEDNNALKRLESCYSSYTAKLNNSNINHNIDNIKGATRTGKYIHFLVTTAGTQNGHKINVIGGKLTYMSRESARWGPANKSNLGNKKLCQQRASNTEKENEWLVESKFNGNANPYLPNKVWAFPFKIDGNYDYLKLQHLGGLSQLNMVVLNTQRIVPISMDKEGDTKRLQNIFFDFKD
jgi:hypothetical protein